METKTQNALLTIDAYAFELHLVAAERAEFEEYCESERIGREILAYLAETP